MTDRTQIPDLELSVDKPVTFQTQREMRDNTTIASWEPYDGVDGLIYERGADGSVAIITTPDFDDGYEYALDIALIYDPPLTGTVIEIDFDLGATTITTDFVEGTDVAGNFVHIVAFREILAPRKESYSHNISGSLAYSGIGGGINTFGDRALTERIASSGFTTATELAIDRASIVFADGTGIAAGRVILWRRTANDGKTVL